jgi:hypothetical protein
VPAIEGVTVLAVGDVADAALEASLRRRYGIAEVCFALKPACCAIASTASASAPSTSIPTSTCAVRSTRR